MHTPERTNLKPAAVPMTPLYLAGGRDMHMHMRQSTLAAEAIADSLIHVCGVSLSIRVPVCGVLPVCNVLQSRKYLPLLRS